MGRRGIALPIVMWSIAFLSGLVLLAAGVVGDWIDEETLAEKKFIARQMAISGLAIGMNPAVERGDPLLASGSRETEGYEVAIENEAARINPNHWVRRGERGIFQRLFGAWGFDSPVIDTAIDSLIDWIDGDDLASFQGAERGDYERAGMEGFPANAELRDIREMEAVLNLGPVLAAKPDWRTYFTIWYDGPISIQHANEPVLREIAGLTPLQIELFLKLRAGVDGIDGTEDDQTFQSLDEVADLVGADGIQRDSLARYFGTSGDVRRIESTGYCGGVAHRITAIFAEGETGGLLSWEER